jgi:hypothetical protein
MCLTLPHTLFFFLIVFFHTSHLTQVFAQHTHPSQCHINGTRLYANANNNMTFDFPYEPRVTGDGLDGGGEGGEGYLNASVTQVFLYGEWGA